jgi:hypothetical protein
MATIMFSKGTLGSVLATIKGATCTHTEEVHDFQPSTLTQSQNDCYNSKNLNLECLQTKFPFHIMKKFMEIVNYLISSI